MENENDELESKVHIMTIVWDEDDVRPSVDLGDVPPQLAITVLQQTITALYECLVEPIIIYNNEPIYSTFFDDEDE
jgi:hypothetical protein